MNRLSLANYFCLCIFVRLVLSSIVYLVYDSQLRYFFVLFYGLFSMGIFYQYIVKTRTMGAFNNKVWWDYLRPIHALIYLSTSIGLMLKFQYTFVFLIIDAFIGSIGYYLHHHSSLLNHS